MAWVAGILGCMELELERLGVDELVAVIDAALTALGDDRVRQADGRYRLSLLAESVRLDARLSAWQSALAAEIERTEVAVQEHGTSTVTWLADATRDDPSGGGPDGSRR